MVFEVDGQSYVVVGNKAIKVDHFDKQGNPVITCNSKETKNANGGTDCTVTVDCLQLAGRKEP